jgi:hypothetical protein
MAAAGVLRDHAGVSCQELSKALLSATDLGRQLIIVLSIRVQFMRERVRELGQREGEFH